MNNPLIEGTDFYFNEAGLMVFTQHYHLAKGYCCGNGCLHCPYDYEAVPEPRRSALLHQRLLRANTGRNNNKTGSL